MEWHSFGELQ